MSMAVCMKCGNFIDTDEDPDSTYFDKGCVCSSCRQDLTPEEEIEYERILNS